MSLFKLAKQSNDIRYDDLIADSVLGMGVFGIGRRLATPHVLKTIHGSKKEPVFSRQVIKNFVRENPHMKDKILILESKYPGAIPNNAYTKKVFKINKKIKKNNVLAKVLNEEMQKGKNIILAKNNIKDVALLHELGHLKDMTGKRGALKTFSHATSRLLGGVGGIALGATMTKSDSTKKYAPLAPWLTYSPMLRSEFVASKYAVKEMVKKHGILKGFKKSLPLALAYGTYMSLPAGVSLGLYLYGKDKKRRAK